MYPITQVLPLADCVKKTPMAVNVLRRCSALKHAAKPLPSSVAEDSELCMFAIRESTSQSVPYNLMMFRRAWSNRPLETK